VTYFNGLGKETRRKVLAVLGTGGSGDVWNTVDTGAKATTEPEEQRWSSMFTYDERSNVSTATDARGVKTTLSYSTGGS